MGSPPAMRRATVDRSALEVLGGLKEGDLIVVEGIIKLRDGAKLRYDAPEAALSETSQGSAQPAEVKARS